MVLRLVAATLHFAVSGGAAEGWWRGGGCRSGGGHAAAVHSNPVWRVLCRKAPRLPVAPRRRSGARRRSSRPIVRGVCVCVWICTDTGVSEGSWCVKSAYPFSLMLKVCKSSVRNTALLRCSPPVRCVEHGTHTHTHLCFLHTLSAALCNGVLFSGLRFLQRSLRIGSDLILALVIIFIL